MNLTEHIAQMREQELTIQSLVGERTPPCWIRIDVAWVRLEREQSLPPQTGIRTSLNVGASTSKMQIIHHTYTHVHTGWRMEANYNNKVYVHFSMHPSTRAHTYYIHMHTYMYSYIHTDIHTYTYIHIPRSMRWETCSSTSRKSIPQSKRHARLLLYVGGDERAISSQRLPAGELRARSLPKAAGWAQTPRWVSPLVVGKWAKIQFSQQPTIQTSWDWNQVFLKTSSIQQQKRFPKKNQKPEILDSSKRSRQILAISTREMLNNAY